MKSCDKYYSCIGNGKHHSALANEVYPISNAILMVFIPNFIAIHAIKHVHF